MSRFSADTARRSVRHLAPLAVSLSLIVVGASGATAAELADAAGVSVVGLVSLVEGDVGDVVSLAVPEARALRAADTAATPIEPGTLDVNVTVHVVFEVG